MFTYPKNLKTIHTFEFMGDRFVYDVNSISFFKIDKLAWEILELAGKCDSSVITKKLNKKYPEREITQTLLEFEKLEQAGELFSEEEPPVLKEKIPWNNMVLQISHDCDLRCKYCFAGHGRYRGASLLMDEKIGERAVDFFLEESRGVNDLTFSLFGGEPLLNFKLIKHLVPYARAAARRCGKEFSQIIIVTNGVQLEENVVRYLEEDRIIVKVSIDGPPEIHDRIRPLPNGRGSHHLIRTGLERMKGTDLMNRTTLRATYCGQTAELSKIFAYFLESGFRLFEVEPAYMPVKNRYAIRKEHIPELKEELGKMGELYLDALHNENPPIFHSLEYLFRRIATGSHKFNECSAGEGSLTISADGSIYPCFELDGIEEYRMGDIFNGVNEDKRTLWLETCFLDSKIHCRECWARYICGGGCRARAIKFKGDILRPFEIECEIKKLYFELAMWAMSRAGKDAEDTASLGFLPPRGKGA